MARSSPPFAFTELSLSEAEQAQLFAAALRRRRVLTQSAAPDGLAAVVATFATASAGPEAPTAVRSYRPREVGVILAACAAFLLVFDSEGLNTWVQRMDVGQVQNAWRAALSPLNTQMERLGLTAVRRWLIVTGERSSRALGVGEDPVMAGGWATPEASGPVAEPLPTQIDLPEIPEIPETMTPDDEPVARQPVTVLLVGDSMIAGSLATALKGVIGKDSRLRVVTAFQTATGLSRPDVYDWMKVLPPLLERERPKLIVCSMGANDPTNIQDKERQLDFGDPGWRTAYGNRVLAMMRVFSATGAQVLWLGLPPMREARFSARTAYLNTIFASSARKVARVEFLELKMLVSDRSGEYRTFVNGPDRRLIRYRLDDGIHYSPAGARSITRWVVDWIYERYRRLPNKR